MKLKSLLLLLLAVVTFTASYAQEGGVRGKVVSRNGREALSNVKVTIGSLGVSVLSDKDGVFTFENLPKGDYSLSFSTPEFEDLDLQVRIDQYMKDLKWVVVSPLVVTEGFDDAVFSEFDTDSGASDAQSLPSSLSSSKDIFNSVASYRFSEMRFNVRGYDSGMSNIMLNGIRFNDAMTGYGPWSLWSGLNDATRNQESVPGLSMSDHGLGGVGGMTNINARASQMRKGFRVSVSNANQMYAFRAMVSYASGQLDNGWSYAFSVGTRQGGNGYVDGVYYNSYSYFASAEKLFGTDHRLALTVLASPSQRGAQQASTDEAYDLFGSNYYNPNVGYQKGKLRNSRVRVTHEPIAVLNYSWDITEHTRLSAATSLRFGKNAYSALTWKDSGDPRGDYYSILPSYYLHMIQPGNSEFSQSDAYALFRKATDARNNFTGMLDFDNFYHTNNFIDPQYKKLVGDQKRSNTMIEDRHTDQLDYNFTANVTHQIRPNMRIIGGINARINRTSYYSKVKDLLGGDYWYDVDKFAERDQSGNVLAAQNDLDYYLENGHARVVKEGDKYNYNYRAHLREGAAWAIYNYAIGGFSLGLGGELGYSQAFREGIWRKGLFPNNSQGDSEKLGFLTYNAKINLGYKLSGAHSFDANIAFMQNAPKFANAFVSPRTRNTATPGISPEKTFGADLTYNLNLPYIKARVSGYYTAVSDQSKVISFYDDTAKSFTNFAMSNIDSRYYGVETAVQVPIWGGISFVGAVSWGDYTYTSNPNFTQTIDNSEVVNKNDVVYWSGSHVASSPQLAINAGLDYRGAGNWFASVNFNYYDKIYLSMNPFYRTATPIAYYVGQIIDAGPDTDPSVIIGAAQAIEQITAQEQFNAAYTLSISVGKNWYIKRSYMLGFSVEVKNILNNQEIRTGGYEQMRMRKQNTPNGAPRYSRFDSKYFYMLGTNYYLNLYFRF